MNRCKRCYMPDTRPGSIFTDGVCQACLNYDKRKDINWAERREELKRVCDTAREMPHQYDCIIPVSGGKDSYTICKIMVEDMNMRPFLVTVTDSFTHTQAGRDNLRNLITYYGLNHWQYTINHDLFKRATRAAFEGTGEALKFVEYAIYTIPYRMAQAMNIPLVMFGENSAYEYGNTLVDSPNANAVIDGIVKKINGERQWWNDNGIDNEEVNSILPDPARSGPVVQFMSFYTPWSSTEHLKIAQDRGFKTLDDTGEWDRQGTCEQYEQIDSVAYMVHLWLKYPKFGFQRAMDIVSRRVREGLMTLDEAKEIAEKVDPILDERARQDFCETLGYTDKEFWTIVKRHDARKVLGDR